MKKPNASALQALAAAASEYDRVAAAVEAEADLWRQCAEHCRRGNVGDVASAKRSIARVIDQQDAKLADGLVSSIRHRDPDLWGEVEQEDTLVAMREMPIGALRALAELHKGCTDSSCPIDAVIRERLGAQRS